MAGIFIQSKHPALLCVVIFVIFLMALSENTTWSFWYILMPTSTPPCTFSSVIVSHGHDVYFCHCARNAHGAGHSYEQELSPWIQMFLYLILGGSEFFPLAAMSYARYVAICHPLCYSILLNIRCISSWCMAAGSWDQWMALCSHPSPWPSPSANFRRFIISSVRSWL